MKTIKRSTIWLSLLITLLFLSGCSLSERAEITITDENGHDVVLNCPKVVGSGTIISGGWCYIIVK